jgi:hypothetical protein
MAGGYSLGSSINLVARGGGAAHKASLVSQTSAGQVTVGAPHLCGGQERFSAGNAKPSLVPA